VVLTRDIHDFVALPTREKAIMPRTFRSKNLAGGVLATDKQAATKPICLLRTFRWLFCTGIGVARQFDREIYVRQLAELKVDLRAALAELEAHEQEIGELVKESSRLAMDELEEGLKEILRQIEQMKQQGSDEHRMN